MKILISFLVLTLLFSCDCENEPIIPTKVVELNSKEIEALTKTSYVVSKINGSEFIQKLSSLKGNNFQFKKSGLIFSNDVRIGKWTNDRWIYLNSIDTKILINLVSRKEMKIYMQYFDCKNESIIEESLHLTGKDEIVNDHNTGIDL